MKSAGEDFFTAEICCHHGSKLSKGFSKTVEKERSSLIWSSLVIILHRRWLWPRLLNSFKWWSASSWHKSNGQFIAVFEDDGCGLTIKQQILKELNPNLSKMSDERMIRGFCQLNGRWKPEGEGSDTGFLSCRSHKNRDFCGVLLHWTNKNRIPRK